MISSKDQILTVYRSVKLDKEEFGKLIENQDKLISTNGFLSASQLHSSAYSFALKPTKRSHIIPVLFQIECNIKQLGKNVIFADIAQYSEYPNEQEVLFELSASFRLESIEEDGVVQSIRMKASWDGESIIKDYLELVYRQTEEKSVSITFGRLICDLGQHDKSQKYFDSC